MMEYYSVVYCYNDDPTIDYYNNKLYEYQYVEEPEHVESEPEHLFWPIALYAGFWTLSLGTFAYQYFKVNDRTNKFVDTVDKCIDYVFPPKSQYDQLMEQIKTFNKNRLYDSQEEYTEDESDIEEETITESDEEYLKADYSQMNKVRQLPPPPNDVLIKVINNQINPIKETIVKSEQEEETVESNETSETEHQYNDYTRITDSDIDNLGYDIVE